MRVSKAALVASIVTLSSLFPAFGQTLEDAVDQSVVELQELTGDAFIDEAETILMRWDELGGNSSAYFDAAEIVIAEIDEFMADTQAVQEALPVPLGALQMIALNYTGTASATGQTFNPEDALAVYDTGIVTSRMGPPMSFRGEYQRIMKRIWIETWGRSNLDGMVGEEAPSDYAKMLFDVFDAPSLCEPGEAVFWSCQDEDRSRLLSVCGSPTSAADASWVQYRVGKPGALELSYPEARMSGADMFEREIWRYGGSTLRFSNGEFAYSIDADSFTDTADISVKRGEEEVFSLSCKTSHPFLDTIGGHLGEAGNDEALTIIPGKVSDEPVTACPATVMTSWSCLDESDGEVLSLCTSGEDDDRRIQFVSIAENGDSRRVPEDPVLLSGEGFDLYANSAGEAVASFTLGNEEYYLSGDKPGETGSMTYWRGGTPRFDKDCTVQSSALPELLSSRENGQAAETDTGFSYSPQPILYGGDDGQLLPSPSAFDDVIRTLKGLEAGGYFEAGKGLTPVDSLGGEAAIPYAMGLRDEAFHCAADHGGICAAPDEIYNLKAFLVGFRDEGGIDWFSPEAAAIRTPEEIDLGDVALTFSALSPPGTPVVRYGDGFCQARAYFEDWEAGNQMYYRAAESLYPAGEPDWDWIWSSFYGVVGRYNVRAEPSASADVIGIAENEAIHFPSFESVTSADGYDWREVALPDGTRGYIGAGLKDILIIDDAGQVCATVDGDEVRLTQITIGGE